MANYHTATTEQFKGRIQKQLMADPVSSKISGVSFDVEVGSNYVTFIDTALPKQPIWAKLMVALATDTM